MRKRRRIPSGLRMQRQARAPEVGRLRLRRRKTRAKNNADDYGRAEKVSLLSQLKIPRTAGFFFVDAVLVLREKNAHFLGKFFILFYIVKAIIGLCLVFMNKTG